MRIAIASSGLGHVARGIETWALETAAALHEAGEEVTLFSAADAPRVPYEVSLPCWRRGGDRAQRWAKRLPGFVWRWGLDQPYGVEQATFWWHLRKHLIEGDHEVLHVQDVWLADWCRRWRERGWLHTQEILAHGTEEPLVFRARFPFLQELAPWHLEQARKEMAARGHAAQTRNWTSIPNFVDTAVFLPRGDAPGRFRRELGLEEEDRVFLCVAAVKKHHKRIDYLIDEFGRCLEMERERGEERLPWLLIAGAHHDESANLITRAERVGQGRIRVFLDLPREDIPELYRSGDVFVLASLFEMMPIAVLEALAAGLPVIAHDHPVLRWMVGDGGKVGDLSKAGALSGLLAETVSPAWIGERGRQARERAETMFSRQAVIPRYIAYYRQALGLPSPPA